MTTRKGKFEYFDWLLFSQVHEVFEHDVGTKERYDEEADIINAIMNDMTDNGYDPVKVYTDRYSAKQDEVRAIVAKYRAVWKEISER